MRFQGLEIVRAYRDLKRLLKGTFEVSLGTRQIGVWGLRVLGFLGLKASACLGSVGACGLPCAVFVLRGLGFRVFGACRALGILGPLVTRLRFESGV